MGANLSKPLLPHIIDMIWGKGISHLVFYFPPKVAMMKVAEQGLVGEQRAGIFGKFRAREGCLFPFLQGVSEYQK